MAQPSGREVYVDCSAIGVDENVEKGANQDEGNMDNHDRHLTRASNQFHDLGFAENNDLAAVENQGIDTGLELSAEESEFLMKTLQTKPRTLTPREQSALEEQYVLLNIDYQLSETGNNFKKNIVKSEKDKFTVTCANEGCPWHMCVKKLPDSTFHHNIIHPEHRCGVIAHPAHRRASIQQVASSVEQPLSENPHYRPTETFEDIHRVHGMPLSHEQALRHQEHYMAFAPGSFEADYSLLSQYCNKVRQTNPGSLASVSVDPMDACSIRLFISYEASIYGFVNACRPLIGLERTVLINKYLSNLLFATGFDGDGAIFPLAFGFVGQESEGNWKWFLSELQNLLETKAVYMPKLTILSNMQKSITAAVETNFPTAYHRHYMFYVSERFLILFPDIVLVNRLWKAANALEILEFDTEVLKIGNISPDAGRWVQTIPPHLWANSHFKGMCFIHPRVSIAESLNAWTLDANGLPIVQMMECINRKLMNLFNERREVSMMWTSVLVPSAERQVSQAVESACSYGVLIRNHDEFIVISSENQKEVVDIRSHCCSCQRWQQYGLPCSYAAAALLYLGQNVSRFAWNYFTVDTYHKAYLLPIHPILPDIIVNTAKLQEQGRKRKTRSSDPGQEKRVTRCSRF